MENRKKEIELLAPAKNLEYGIAAINCGADAVYIGAKSFGARYSAGNSTEDIAKLVEYAHVFNAKVFVTLNTILYENELEESYLLAKELCDIGVDALIVQDMSFMMYDLPIALHASTQCATYNVERAKFLEEVGFERVILERALSLEQIQTIRKGTTVELEAFVHGAICVCYSGECFMGQVVSSRSGNRGVCSQPCRSEYNLLDQNGREMIRSKHLLSLGDMMLSNSLSDLIHSGVTSFKIEGRLKDISYLKNTVLHYREQLDKIISSDTQHLKRSSVGLSKSSFSPDLNKSFTRGFSSYYINGAVKGVASFHTAKATGERIAVVDRVFKDSFTINTKAVLNNGDGICFVTKEGEFTGTNINVVAADRIFPNRMNGISEGVEIYRNSDTAFLSMVTSAKIGRKISAEMTIRFSDHSITLTAVDSEGVCVESSLEGEFEEASNIENSTNKLIEQLNKSGDTPFEVVGVHIEGSVKFLPISLINSIRRSILEKLCEKRVSLYRKPNRSVRKIVQSNNKLLSYKASVSNSLAEKFYRECGYQQIEPSLESSSNSALGLEVMRMSYCIRREIGQCLKEGGVDNTLFLENNRTVFELKFDCKRCEMSLVYRGTKDKVWKRSF